ncbi:hypothetical protein N8D56_09835 [Devosia sp. A8/3-2]|nr:hypothetical protein N8D56_09835 [Devosia sp. A8/3-2]
MKQDVSVRRSFERPGRGLAGAVAPAALLAAAAPALAQQQSPMLDAQVESGELPPVAERLPSNPLVVEPVESVGTYGGTGVPRCAGAR